MTLTLVAPHSLNHVAYPTWDSAATYRFYTSVLNCRFVAAIGHDRVPSSGEPSAYLHTFFQFDSGECIAFFEVDGLARPGTDGVPSWIRHIAFNVESVEVLEHWRQQLLAKGIDVVGTVDHDGTWQSIYLFDPNAVRIELTVQTRPLTEQDRVDGWRRLQSWAAERGQVLDEQGPQANGQSA